MNKSLFASFSSEKEESFFRRSANCSVIRTFCGAAMAAVLAWLPAAAKPLPVQYLLENTEGSPYCDGLLLTVVKRVVTGVHNSPADTCTEGDQAGGFAATGFTPAGVDTGVFKVSAKTKLLTVTTEEPAGGTGYEVVFNLDLKAMTWSLWAESGPGGVSFQPINSGILAIDEPGAIRVMLNRPALFR
jgi:hypothetical protein